MNNHIIITPTQAELIRGNHGKYSAIEPVLTPDDNYIVPEDCINDPDLIYVKEQLQGMKRPDNVQNIKDINEAEISTGKLVNHNGLAVCIDAINQVFSYDTKEQGTVKKSVMTATSLTVDKEQIKALTTDADGNIKKLAGNVKNYVADLTEGTRTQATDTEVEKLINDGNIIITNQ